MQHTKISKLLLDELAKSSSIPPTACILVDQHDTICGRGYGDVVILAASTVSTPAEAMACENMCADAAFNKLSVLTAYVTHVVLPGPAHLLSGHGVTDIRIIELDGPTPEVFTKHDEGKLRYELIPPSALKGIAEVLTHGAEKYTPNNWRNVTDLTRYEGAMMRHFEAYRSGELLDKDSGLPHLAHCMTNLVFLLELTSQTDDSGQ